MYRQSSKIVEKRALQFPVARANSVIFLLIWKLQKKQDGQSELGNSWLNMVEVSTSYQDFLRHCQISHGGLLGKPTRRDLGLSKIGRYPTVPPFHCQFNQVKDDQPWVFWGGPKGFGQTQVSYCWLYVLLQLHPFYISMIFPSYGGFLKLGIPKSPWGSIQKRPSMTWMICGIFIPHIIILVDE